MAKKFNGKVCPECGEGRLRHGTKQISFTYRGETLIYGQVGAWCSHCDEGVMTGTESASTAAEVQAFMDKVGEQQEMEKSMLDFAENVQENSRLSCQITVSDDLDGLRVTTPESQH